jgi:hypothetical protein
MKEGSSSSAGLVELVALLGIGDRTSGFLANLIVSSGGALPKQDGSGDAWGQRGLRN